MRSVTRNDRLNCALLLAVRCFVMIHGQMFTTYFFVLCCVVRCCVVL